MDELIVVSDIYDHKPPQASTLVSATTAPKERRSAALHEAPRLPMFTAARPWWPCGRSQGGVQLPTGGVCASAYQPASARHNTRRGQQTRFNSEADGIVRMEENDGEGEPVL